MSKWDKLELTSDIIKGGGYGLILSGVLNMIGTANTISYLVDASQRYFVTSGIIMVGTLFIQGKIIDRK